MCVAARSGAQTYSSCSPKRRLSPRPMSTHTPASRVPNTHRITFFTATWCMPCKRVKQRLHDLLGKDAYEKCVEFVDVDDASSAAKMTEYGVKHIPILVFHHHAEEVVVKTASDHHALHGAVTTWLARGAATLPIGDSVGSP